MLRKTMLVPNVLFLGCAVFLFHGSLLSGNVTRTALLAILTPILPLWYCCGGKTWMPLKIAAILINAVPFLMSGYMFSGMSYMLFKHGMLNPTAYLIVGVLWAAALFSGILKDGKHIAAAGWAFNIILCLCAAAGLYFWSISQWMGSMHIVLFAAIMVITILNVRLFQKAACNTVN